MEEKSKEATELRYMNEDFEKAIGEYQERLFDTQTELTNEFNKNKEFVETNQNLIKTIEDIKGKKEYFEAKYSKFKGKFEEETERNAIFTQENHGLITSREALEQDFSSLKQLLEEERRDNNEKSNFIDKMRGEWNHDKDKLEKQNSNVNFN